MPAAWMQVTPGLVGLLNFLLIGLVGVFGWLVCRSAGPPGVEAGPLFRLWLVQTRMWGVFLLVFGIKLYWIHHYVINIPFYDQWDAEGMALYVPYLEGRLRIGDLFQPHNEHRLFWTRIWALGLLELNGQWDTRWQSVANAALHSYTAAVVAETLVRLGRGRLVPLWIGLVVFLFAGPQVWENLRFGFQSQFYFLQFFSVSGLCLLLLNRPGKVGWWMGWPVLGCAFFSSSGAVLVIGVALVGLFLLQLGAGDRKGWIGVGLALVLFVVCWRNLPQTPGHDAIRAEGPFRMGVSFLHLMAWPTPSRQAGTGLAALIAFVQWAPWLWVVAREGLAGFRGEERNRTFGLILVFGGWFLAVALGAAYARGDLPAFGYAHRYADLFGMGFLAALGAVGLTWRAIEKGRHTGWLRLALVVCVVSWGVGFYRLGNLGQGHFLPLFRGFGYQQLANVDGYVQTGEPEFLLNKDRLAVPYPQPERLMDFLAHESIRSLLPTTVREPVPLGPAEGAGAGNLLGGVPEGMAAVPGEAVWGTYAAEEGAAFQDEVLLEFQRPPKLPFLVYGLGGDPRAEGLSIRAEYADGTETALWRTEPGLRWLDRRVATGEPAHQLRLVDHSETAWVAIRVPREMGRFSFASILLGKAHGWVGLTGGLFLLSAGVAWAWVGRAAVASGGEPENG